MQEVVCCLVRVKTPQGTSSYLIPKSEFFIGRSQETDLPFPDPSLSRQHLKVVVASDRILVTDLGSANGSKLGNQSLSPQEPIGVRPQDGVQLGFAEVFFFFELVQMPMQMLPREHQVQQMRQQWQVLWDQLESERQDLIRQTRAQMIEAWNREYDELKSQARAEAANIKQKAQSQAEVILQKNRSEIENQRTLAQEEIQELRIRFDHWKLENETSTLQSLSEKKAEVEKQTEMLRQQAQEEARSILSKAHLKAEAELREAQARAQDLRNQADSEAERRGRDLREQLQRMESESRRSSEQLVSEAREFSEKLKSESREVSAKKLAEAEMQVQKILSEARASAQRELESARAEAEQILNSRSDEGQALLKKAQLEANLLMEKEIQRVDTWSRDYKNQIENELQNLREDGLQKIRRETEEQQLAVLRKFSEQTTEAQLRAEKQVLEAEKSAQELRRLQEQRESLKTDLAHKESAHKLLSSELDLLQKERQEAEALIAQRNQLKKDLEALELALVRQREALAKIQDEQRETKAGIIKEAQSLKDQLIVEHEGAKKKLAEEAQRAQLRAFEELKQRLDLEEKKLREIRKAQSYQVARSIELKLVAAGLRVPEGLVPQTVGGILGESEKLLQLETQHLIESPEQGQKRRQKRFQQGVVASLLLVLGLGIWQRRELQDFLRQGGFASYAQKMIEQRKLASIYRPPQDLRYRDSYTDNVLFLEAYVQTKTDPEYTREWTMTLNDLELIRSMGLSEEDMVQVVTKEFNLVQRLRDLRDSIDAHYLEEGLQKMREAEAETREELKSVLRTTKNYERLRRLERISLEDFRKRKGSPLRSKASESDPDPTGNDSN